MDAHQLLGQTMTRQGDRTNMIDEYQRTKSKTAINSLGNSLGNTLGHAIFFTNEFGGQRENQPYHIEDESALIEMPAELAPLAASSKELHKVPIDTGKAYAMPRTDL